jgi:hypothetical protein
MKQSQRFSIHLRYPSWLRDKEFRLFVNGSKAAFTKDATGYVVINRLWKNQDKITMQLPMATRVLSLPDGSPWVSFLKGPIVLAAATDTTDLVGLHADSSRMGHIANGKLYSLEDAPMLLLKGAVSDTLLQPIKEAPMQFHLKQLSPSTYKDLVLKPFFQIHDARYMIYWPVATPDALMKKQQGLHEKEQALLALEAQTVDYISPGEQQPESDHLFQGERTLSGIHMDRHWRHAEGWFSYVMQNKQLTAQKIRLTFFGGDSNRSFDVWVNDALLTTIRLTGERGAVFYEQDVNLSDTMRRASNLVIKFVAHPNSVAGGIYGVRLMK